MPARNQFKPGPAVGTRFGKLVVIAVGEPIIESGRQQVAASVCRCDCGKIFTVRNYVLTRKRSPAKSCGCTRKHGKATRQKLSRAYTAWLNMKTRCRRDKRYADIHICDAWFNSFQAFIDDMGECPEGLTLDRIDTTGNYEPSNCRWATMKQQNNNKTSNHTITVNGVSKTVVGWMEHHRLDKTTFYRRLILGWTEEEAASTPKLARHARWGRSYQSASPNQLLISS
jgi:hypothetical protein